jgi:site-specific DNA recombinase
MKTMTKAALYARVSSDGQKQERTIESQVAELKRQIAAAGHQLVKEYIDDGYSGAYLDRPALLELLGASTTDTFDVVYFLCADRIAREAIHQNIIVAELAKHKKRIVISGKEHEENPEHKLTLQVLGAVSEFERAKITERMMRGKLHRMRKGELASGGVRAFGYDYVRKSDTSPASLVVNEAQAAVVRMIFEMYGSGVGLCAISEFLEEQRAPTCKTRRAWNANNIRRMLRSDIYTGVHYINRWTYVRDPSGSGKRSLVDEIASSGSPSRCVPSSPWSCLRRCRRGLPFRPGATNSPASSTF